MKKNMLDTIVKAIRDKNTRWDGLVQLKELETSDEIYGISEELLNLMD